MTEASKTPKFEARICKDMPAGCCDYGVISFETGKEVCRVWLEEDARKIADLLNAAAVSADEPTVVFYHDLMLKHGNYHAAEQDLIGRANRGEKVWIKADLTRWNQAPPPALIRHCERAIVVYAGGLEKVTHDRTWSGVGSYQKEAS